LDGAVLVGEGATAWRVLDRLLDTLMAGGNPRIFENHDPLTGRGQDCPNFGRHGMLVDVVLTALLGIRIADGRLAVGNPLRPETIGT
jgi:hypothetical protein